MNYILLLFKSRNWITGLSPERVNDEGLPMDGAGVS